MNKLLLVFVLGLMVLTGCGGPYQFAGTTIQSPRPANDWTLPDHQDRPFQLSAQRGKVVFVYFGYTNCRDFCPTTMGDWKQIRQQLGDDADQVQFVMVTVDPEHDTQQVLGEYLGRFDPAFIGLRPTQEQLESLSKEYGVGVDSHAAGHDKTQLHGTHSYLLDPQGQLRVVYPYDVDTEAITSDIKQLLRSSSIVSR